MERMKTTCHEQSFESQGVSCAGRLYRPADVERPPIVVMAHGFGGELTWRLAAIVVAIDRVGFS